jgi:flagellin
MVINSNQSASRAARLLGDSTTRLMRSIARLSSGSRITSPEVDAAGLAVSSKLSSQNRRNRAAESNLENAISLSQTQDGYLQKVQKALDRMSELTVLAQD